MNETATLTLSDALERIGILFYLVSPSRSSFATVEEVPDYVDKAVPLFLLTIVLDWIIMTFLENPEEDYQRLKERAAKNIVKVTNAEGKVFEVKSVGKFTDVHRTRLNDGMTSIMAGMIQQLVNLLILRSIDLGAYIWVYNNLAIVQLDYKSTLTWVLGLLFIDFGYYWFHRASHEINILWAGHVVHHSSEDYNMTTALRQSAFQGYFGWAFYLPLAFFLPPPIYLVHRHFNLLFQYWVHTDWIPKLGPLEYIINTPSHHRVHHGSNPYCIDKNYAGTLIIWDRMFGTFQEEVEGSLVYGITHPLNTFDPLTIQTHHFVHILRTAWSTPGFMDKVWVFLKGPGWSPGKPRLGLIEEIPKVDRPTPKYNPVLARSFQIYALIQYIGAFAFYLTIGPNVDDLSSVALFGLTGFVLYSCYCIGKLLDVKSNAIVYEFFRLAFGLTMALVGTSGEFDAYFPENLKGGVRGFSVFFSVFFSASGLFLCLQAMKPNPLGAEKGPVRRYAATPISSKKK